MSDQIKITNKTRVSFRRAGLRFPANSHIIVAIEDLSDDQKQALENKKRLEITLHENELDPKTETALNELKEKAAQALKAKIAQLKKAETAHEKAMTAARKIKDPVKRQAAQDKANAVLAKAQAIEEANEE